MKRAVLICGLILLVLSNGFGQGLGFGKNKVQYTSFDWYFIQTDHFDIYYYNNGYDLAQFTAHAAEEAYNSIRKTFRYQLTNRVPIIVYVSHNDFQQTNVVQPYMDEGIGGVTELFKNRVVMPFRGDYSEFRHVLHHELVHAVVNDMFYGGSVQSIISNNIQLQIPLWFNEGLAEYESLRWDTESDMFMRDATVNEYLPRQIPYLYGYLAYRGGQSVWYYIAETYGHERIADILHRIKGTRSVEQGFRAAIGLGMEELSEKWFLAQREMYWPDVAKRQRPPDFAERMTNHRRDNSFMNNSPSLSPQGDKIAYISDRRDYYSVYLMSAIDGRVLRRVIQGYNTTDFEQLHLLTPGISWSPDGSRIALASKSGARDAIHIIPVEGGRRQRLTFDLDAINTVKWSPQGDYLAFIGTKDAKPSLYLYHIEKKDLVQLTDDYFTDSEPAWTPDGKTIYFISDRGEYLSSEDIPRNFRLINHNINQFDIYAIDISSGKIARVTNSPDVKKSVIVSPEGNKLLYINDSNGIYNIYARTLETGEERPITNSMNPIYQLSISADGTKLTFSSQFEGGYDIFLMRNPLERDLKMADLEPTEFLLREQRKSGLVSGREEPEVAVSESDTLLAEDTVEPVVAISEPDTLLAEDIVEPEDAVSEPDTLLTENAVEPVDVAVDTTETVDIAETIPQDTTDITETAPQDTVTEASVYGDDIKIDLGSYVFGDHVTTPVAADPMVTEIFNVTDNIDAEGNFIPNDYRLNFSPDIVVANAGYSTFWGVQGSTLMAFSDMLGDHQIYFLTNLQIDLKNSDYGLAYFYLPGRNDWAFQGFHTARFLYQLDPMNPFSFYSLYRYRTYGASMLASRPFDKFRRLEFGLSWLNISRENLDRYDDPIQRNTVFFPSISYVHDNVLWGYISPRRGSRYNLTVHGSPKISSNSIAFMSVLGDYRTYTSLGSDYTLALRLTGGSSFGPNPQRFMLGGMEGWINRRFEDGYIPIEDAQDFVFLTPILPMRGYNYNKQIGKNFALMNFEMRYPLIRYFVGGPLPLALQNIMGVTFLDVGSAWDDSDSWRAFERGPLGNRQTRDLLIGTGFGARIVFLGFLVRFDVAWNYNLDQWSKPKYYWSLGLDF
jgi:Tol biopolymer transport system component